MGPFNDASCCRSANQSLCFHASPAHPLGRLYSPGETLETSTPDGCRQGCFCAGQSSFRTATMHLLGQPYSTVPVQPERDFRDRRLPSGLLLLRPVNWKQLEARSESLFPDLNPILIWIRAQTKVF
jgi:hypothetical protein